MSGSGRKNAVYRPLSRIRPLIHHRFAAVPLPRRGRVKSFPYGRCVAQRIESNIAAGWQLYHKKRCWLGAAETEEGRNERKRQEKRSIPTALAHKAPHPPPLRGGPPSPEGKVGGLKERGENAMLLNMERVCKTYGDRTLLDHVTFYMKQGDRVGVVGVNGCGKSTFLRLAAGREKPDSGAVSYDPNVRLGYLPQDPPFDPENTVMEQVEAGLDKTAREVARYEAVEILTRLGITDTQQKMGSLSGGQRKRVALAACLVHPADLLLLDEPTNHLDAEMIGWLENYLQRFTGGILLVTHDRYFLERVADRTLEVSFGRVYLYEGGYSAYLDGRARREEMDGASERKRQSILRRELQWVLQGPCARGTKSRERLERYEALKAAQPPQAEQSLEGIQALSSRLGKKTVELKGVGKAFDGRWVLKDFDFLLQRTDRVGIVGGNGAGKSTLLNLIAGEIPPDEGTVTVGDTVVLGYFSQHAKELDPNQTALDYVKERGDRIETPEGTLTASRLMDKFLFSGPMQHRLIGKLSGGEKRRLFLLGILASAPNVLLLDEPTNDLDIPTMTVLENYLETFPGAIIAVSHDRYFLDRLCTRVFAVEPGGAVRQYVGGYSDYLESLGDRPKQEKKAPKETEKPKARKLKFSFREQREYESIDGDIAALEAQLEENRKQQDLSGADFEKLQDLMAEQGALEQQLEEKTERWMYLTELAEKIARQA